MPIDTLARLLVPALIVAFAAHRGYYVKYYSRPEEATMKAREQGIASKVASLLGLLGFASVVVYTIRPTWLAFAELGLPAALRWGGIAMALTGFALLQWAQTTLGKSWSDQPRMMRDQELVTSGPYRWIRHPIYTAFILILGSILFISSNWLVGLCWAGMTILEVISRVHFEEALMIEYFGDHYRGYMKRTGSLFPHLWK